MSEQSKGKAFIEHHTIMFVAGEYTRRGQNSAEAQKVIEETLETDVFDGPVARVRRSYGLTLKMAERYEMARIDVAVELPCAVNDLDFADEKARLFVEERVKAEAAEIRAHRDQYGSA